MRIQANPQALAAHGLNLQALRAAVAGANVNQPKGNFDGPERSFMLDANDQLRSPDAYRDLIIAYRDGAPLRLSDVADVVDGAENRRLSAWANEMPAVLVNIQRQPGANVIDVVDRIERLLPQLTATLPSTLDVVVISNRTETIRASVRDVQHELIFAVALVVMVTFLFLRNVPATLIPSVVVPLSLIGTFGVMYLAGFSVNNLTLMALTIATGFVVDDAIVMVENIARHLEEGQTPFEAALLGAKEIGFTLVSLTISLIAVLIPLLFMADVVGRLFREFAITLAVSILISLVVSLTLTPMMSARLLRHHKGTEEGWFYRGSGAVIDWMIAAYGRQLQWVLRHQMLTLLVAVATLVLTVVLYMAVPKGFFPVQDTGAIQAISEAPQSVSFSAMAERQQAAAKAILAEPDVTGLSSFIGVDGSNQTLNSGRMLITLKPHEQRTRSAAEVIASLRERLRSVPGHHALPPAGAGPDDRGSRQPHAVSVHPRRPRLRPAERVGAEADRPAEQGARTARRRQRPAGSRAAGVPPHRPRCRQPPGHQRVGHRRRALRRLRAAADLDDLHAGEPVPRRARSGAAVPDRPRLAGADPRRDRRWPAGAAGQHRARRGAAHGAWSSTTPASSPP